jgi:putative flavoprotein involved in K+ transport
MNEETVEPAETLEPAVSFEVVVIGAGQAGLAIGYFLKRQGGRFVVLDTADSVGSAWRTRWDSLTLFTSRRYSALPDLPFPGDPGGYPTRDEVIAYLERHAETFQLPVELASKVEKLDREDDGRFRLEVADRMVHADQVVVATGPFQTPYVPKLAERLAGAVFQTHADGYRRPDDVPRGTVLVVGGGNTGFQIAKELSASRKVVLSVGSRQKPLPQRLLGRDLFWWLTKARILSLTVESRLGSRLQHRDTLIGSSPRELERRCGVELKPRAVDAEGRTVRFDDGSELEIGAAIWATGYRPDYSWIDLPIFDEDGRLRHRRGVTDVPGLYFLGLTWQHTRGSALVGWVKEDAEFIAERIAKHRGSKIRAGRAGMPVGSGATGEARSIERSWPCSIQAPATSRRSNSRARPKDCPRQTRPKWSSLRTATSSSSRSRP